MATFAFVLWTQKQKPTGEVPIYLRITEHRKPRYISTGIAVLPKQWNDQKQEIRKNHDNHVPLNDYLERLLTEAKNTELQLKENPRDKIASTTIKKAMTGDIEQSTDFKEYAQEYVQHLKDRDQYWQWKKVRLVVEKIDDFTDGTPLPFADITPTFLRQFDTWLQTNRENSVNTRYKNLSVFRRIIRQAIKDQIIPVEQNPFLHYELHQEKTSKDKLTLNEIQKLERADLTPGSWVWHSRNYFLFSFYCAGIRFGDLCCLRWKNVARGRLQYTMNKTGTRKRLKLIPQAKAILRHYGPETYDPERYIFPLLENDQEYRTDEALKKRIAARNALVNKYLKDLMKAAKVTTNISFHIARHSFADYARQKGMDLYALSKALGHSSLTITENYLKSFDEEQVDEAVGALFEDSHSESKKKNEGKLTNGN